MIPRWKRIVSQLIQENRKSKEGEKGSVQGRESQAMEREEDLSVERVALRLSLLEESKQEQEVSSIVHIRENVSIDDFSGEDLWKTPPGVSTLKV